MPITANKFKDKLPFTLLCYNWHGFTFTSFDRKRCVTYHFKGFIIVHSTPYSFWKSFEYNFRYYVLFDGSKADKETIEAFQIDTNNIITAQLISKNCQCYLYMFNFKFVRFFGREYNFNSWENRLWFPWAKNNFILKNHLRYWSILVSNNRRKFEIKYPQNSCNMHFNYTALPVIIYLYSRLIHW